MKILKYLVPIILFLLIVWVDLPDTIILPIPHGKNKVTSVNIHTINLPIFNIHWSQELKTHLGLDLQGGSHLLFNVDTSKVKAQDLTDALNSARDIIEKRVNLYGVSEPVIQTLKSNNQYRISVDLPGISNVSQAVSLIGATAQLSFNEEGNYDPQIATQASYIYKLQKPSGLTGKDVKKATVAFDPQTGKPQVALSFTPQGTKLFGEITQRNVGKPLGIFIDYYPISAPIVQSAITDGNAVINGDFTLDQTKELAVAINSGALPLPIQLVEQRNIGPTLGAIEVQRSVIAGVTGLIMVMLFMILYYGTLGWIACMALIIYGLISFALFRLIPVVLTLPGVAGFILSIGMAVDSNILIFERIKEELRKGREFHIAIRLGFGRALSAIKDANITTLIVAFILFNPLNWEFLPQFGLVRGFALTLAIGVATSLFTGIVITRRLIDLFYKTDINKRRNNS